MVVPLQYSGKLVLCTHMNTEHITGHLILLMGPSGSGKRTLIAGLGDLAEKLYFAKTYTSRTRREGAEENPQYEFVSRETFKKMIEAGEFIEWANFSGNYYGTPVSEFTASLMSGHVVFKEMELQGIEQIKELIPKEKRTIIYIDAGSWEELKNRITTRAPISEAELQLRYERYLEETRAIGVADVVIDNTDGNAKKAQQEFRSLVAEIVAQVEASVSDTAENS